MVARRRRGTRGFSLMDVTGLVLMAATGAAMMLLLGAWERKAARIVTCRQNLRQVGMATALYTEAFGAPPLGAELPDAPAPERIGTSIIWQGPAVGVDAAGRHVGLGLLTIEHERYIGDARVLYCPGDPGAWPSVVAQNRPRPAHGRITSSYIYRYVEGASGDGRRRGIAADRNYLGFHSRDITESVARVNHWGAQANVLYDDGSVVTLDNAYPGTPSDLRLDMTSATPATGTDGTVEAEMARAWSVYEAARGGNGAFQGGASP